MGDSTIVKYFQTEEAAQRAGEEFCQRLGRGYSPSYRVFKALGQDSWVLEMTCWDSCD